MNSINLVGHLTRDPELKSMPDGRPVCNMRVAVNGGKGQQPTFVDVATFGPGAAACAEYLRKGRSVEVTGKLVLRQWTAADGSKRSKHSVIGRVQFGTRRNGAPEAA